MSRRMGKIDELIHQQVAKEIATIFGGGNLVTITDAKVSKDLHNAEIWVAVYNQKDQERVMDTLKRNKLDIQKVLNSSLEMKYVPKISFKLDETGEKADRIEQILNKINQSDLSILQA
jgi:ribosome-binding factor A